MEEIWKDIPNYEGYYQVSNFGNVRTLERIIKNKKGKEIKYKSKLRKPSLSEYRMIALCKNGNVKVFKISRLVCILFVNGKNDLNNIVNHKDGNKYNDVYTNLEWSNNSENIIHAYDNNLNKCKNKIRGVFFEKRRNKWVAYLYRNNKNIFLGRFQTEKEAINEYNLKLNEYNKNKAIIC
jgi:hypothetical protein